MPTFPRSVGPTIGANVQAQPSLSFESRHRTRDGRIFPVEISANYFEYGGRTYNLALVRDITEHKRAADQASRLAAIVESSEDAILSKTLEGIIVSWNKGAYGIYGYTAEEAVGKPVSILVPPDHPDEMPQLLRRVGQGESVEHFGNRVAGGRMENSSPSRLPFPQSEMLPAESSALRR